MPFDNAAFTGWLNHFTAKLVDFGLTPPQAIALREKRYAALAGAFAAGQSADDMAFVERLLEMD